MMQNGNSSMGFSLPAGFAQQNAGANQMSPMDILQMAQTAGLFGNNPSLGPQLAAMQLAQKLKGFNFLSGQQPSGGLGGLRDMSPRMGR
jgi:hypothetical protein